MANLTKDPVRVILQNAPKGTDPSKIIDGLVAQGHKLEGFNDQPEEKSMVRNMAEGLIRAPATMIARPIQAAAMLAGADENKIDEVTKNIAGDFVAPIPRDLGDVKKILAVVYRQLHWVWAQYLEEQHLGQVHRSNKVMTYLAQKLPFKQH